ncbi:hypothetical protein CAC42_2644 [Sphaceloma murrayae]|uniref:Pathogen-related protein n=1 Tax=Sphaceloma murrayae TaxID=2082308 RepID=A0A2K1QHF0_9PEZI|nr:hypothetical protein CAC42_2644 [Sphaceloma murrayae]
MAAADVQQPPAEAAPALPDYLTTPNATLGDKEANWRYGKAPDYSKTRKVWEDTKVMNHTAGSLPQLVENLVKNWEVEASFKLDLKDWRTIDHEKYTFAINGGPPQSGEYMLQVGTYNAILNENEFYSPANSDLASSHKTFKRMMPTFAWEVLEVYSGPPTVSFKWRHWGTMKNDYVGFNNKGEKVTAKAHGGPIEITGVTVATVNDKVQLQSVDTYFDPMTMFKQIAPEGIVNLEPVPKGSKISPDDALDMSMADLKLAAEGGQEGKPDSTKGHERGATNTGYADVRVNKDLKDNRPDVVGRSAEEVHPHPKDMESQWKPGPGQAVVAAADSEETKLTHEEMSKSLGADVHAECPFMAAQK